MYYAKAKTLANFIYNFCSEHSRILPAMRRSPVKAMEMLIRQAMTFFYGD